MGRLFITGDTHNDIDVAKLNAQKFPAQNGLCRDDVVLIAGDFGLPWDMPESGSDKWWLKWYENKQFTTVFIDGNHENFDMLKTYPDVIFAGARCHQIRPHVFHVKRGEVLELSGHRILCMGGAKSTDKSRRKEHISWWREEIPDQSEWDHAEESLIEKRPDIIVTHDVPSSATRFLYEGMRPDVVKTELEHLLYLIEQDKIPVKDWYFGHHHMDREFQIGSIQFHARFDCVSKVREREMEKINEAKSIADCRETESQTKHRRSIQQAQERDSL